MSKRKRFKQQQEKQQRFSIRKLTIGTCSLVIGAFLIGNTTAQAAEEPTIDESTETILNNESTSQTTSEQADEDVVADTLPLPDTFESQKPLDESTIEAALQDEEYTQAEYTIFPTVKEIQYLEGLTTLNEMASLIYSSKAIDVYTENRLKEILQDHDISYTKANHPVTEQLNISLNIYNPTQAENKDELFEQIDAYRLRIDNQNISILGKDTDAVFYGLTTLKHILSENPLPVIRNLEINDYADLKNRGFIEGYYGNPWSNKDRIQLMRYGGDLKMTHYLFAPKDDPYHNKQWRELYPQEELEGIREMARVGNETKTRYVWTIHPFMNSRIDFSSESTYQKDLSIIKQKFTQLLDVGVREFAVLADDAPNPVGGYQSYTKLMTDLTDWLTEKQAVYPGLRNEMMFVPSQYYNNGTHPELKHLNAHLPKESHQVLTGGQGEHGAIWGEANEIYLEAVKHNLEATGDTYRPISLWINWPVTDNAKRHLILGGGGEFLHPNINPSLLQGIILNPMQQSEPSKIALFSGAEYTWNIWDSKDYAKHVNDIAFNFAENETFSDSKASIAFRELGKHMINQNMDGRVVKLEESVELAPLLTNFLTQFENGNETGELRKVLDAEFKKIYDAAAYYKEYGRQDMVNQIHYWLDNAMDQMKALEEILEATKYVGKDTSLVWDHYLAAKNWYEQSKTYEFWYVDHYERAEFGVQHIRPFINSMLELLSKDIELALDPNQLLPRLVTNRSLTTGGLDQLVDGNLNTEIDFRTPNTIEVGDYVGLVYNRLFDLNQVSLALGRNSNLNDTFNAAKLEYLNADGEWVKIERIPPITDNPIYKVDDLELQAQGVRVIATAKKDNIWLGIREFAVNSPLEIKGQQTKGSTSFSDNIQPTFGTTGIEMTDDDLTTLTYFKNKTGADNTPDQAWIQYRYEEVTPIRSIRIIQDTGDKIDQGVLEISKDGQEWQVIKEVTGETIINYTQPLEAQYVRIRNTQAMPKWWRIYEFEVLDVESSNELIDTNVESLKENKVTISPEHYTLMLEPEIVLGPNEYIGIKMDQIQEIIAITPEGTLNDQLTIIYSPNGYEWFPATQLKEQPIARYIRLLNESDTEQAIGITHLTTDIRQTPTFELVDATIGISSYEPYAQQDIRNKDNLAELFDGSLLEEVKFQGYPREGNTITIKLDVPREIHKLRAYIKDATINYLRDGIIQISADGQTWIDVIEVGDRIENTNVDNSLNDGWIHDSQRPGNRYIEGVLDELITANYLRILMTADYNHRFLAFTEIEINDGEYIETQVVPNVRTDISGKEGHGRENLVDGQPMTSFIPNQDNGTVTYYLSHNMDDNIIRLLSQLPQETEASLRARIMEQGIAQWVDLGSIKTSFDTFVLPENADALLEIELLWHGGIPEFYELTTFKGDPKDYISKEENALPEESSEASDPKGSNETTETDNTEVPEETIDPTDTTETEETINPDNNTAIPEETIDTDETTESGETPDPNDTTNTEEANSSEDTMNSNDGADLEETDHSNHPITPEETTDSDNHTDVEETIEPDQTINSEETMDKDDTVIQEETTEPDHNDHSEETGQSSAVNNKERDNSQQMTETTSATMLPETGEATFFTTAAATIITGLGLMTLPTRREDE